MNKRQLTLIYLFMTLIGIPIIFIMVIYQNDFHSLSLRFGYMLGVYCTIGIMLQLKYGGKKL